MSKPNQSRLSERSEIARALVQMSWEGKTPEERTARLEPMRRARWATHPNRKVESDALKSAAVQAISGDTK
jgi:hypothetical protein